MNTLDRGTLKTTLGALKLYCYTGNIFFSKLLEIQTLLIPSSEPKTVSIEAGKQKRYSAAIPVSMKIHETENNVGGYSYIQQSIGHCDH